MKLKFNKASDLSINKTSDLSSISVLPPQSRKGSNSVGNGLDSSSIYGRSQTMGSQLRSQQQPSQMSFSQGGSSQHGLFSQFSQSSLDETLTAEKLGSQERDNSLKRASGLPPTGYAREENQVTLSRNSGNFMRKWSGPEQKRQTSEELEHRMGMVETSLNKLGTVETSLNRLAMVLDSVQSDVMHANRGAKEVTLEMDGVRQKLVAHDGALQSLNTGQEDIKNRLDMTLKTLSDQIKQNMNQDNLQEISTMLSNLPEKMECQMAKLQTDLSKKLHADLSKDFNQKIQDLTCSLQILKQKLATPSVNIPKAATCCVPTQQVPIPNDAGSCVVPSQHVQTPNKAVSFVVPTQHNAGSCVVPSQQVQIPNKAVSFVVPTQQVKIPNNAASCIVQSQQVQIPNKAASCIVPTQQVQIPNNAPRCTVSTQRVPIPNIVKKQAKKESLVPKVEVGGWKSVKLERPTTRAGILRTRNKQIKVSPSHMITRSTIVIESDEEADDGFFCLLKEKGSEADGHLIEESNKETARILRKARLRKRKHSNVIVIN